MSRHALFYVSKVVDNKVYVIDDYQHPHLTVTNDAEWVVEQICAIYGKNVRIIYKDTDGYWDELVHTDGVFKTFGIVTERELRN